MSALRNVRSICKTLSPLQNSLKGKKWEISPYLKHGPCYDWSVVPIGNLEKRLSRKSFLSDLSVKKKIDFNYIALFNEEENPDSSRVYSLTTPNRNILLYKGVSPCDNWQILGKGGYGVVVKASYKGQDVAVKVVRLFLDRKGQGNLRGYGKRSLLRERNALQLTHPHVLPVLLVEQGPKYGLVVTERQSALTLQYLLSHKCITSHHQKLRIVEQICLGVQYCHQNGIIHLDLKPINILLDCYGSCKITDFGNSVIMDAFGKFGTSLGTVIYSAPELFVSANQQVTAKCDIYSTGIIMWQLISGAIPYSTIKDVNTIIYQVVKHNVRPETPQLPRVASIHFKDWLVNYNCLYRKCWVRNPVHRPDINQVLASIKKLQQFEVSDFNFNI